MRSLLAQRPHGAMIDVGANVGQTLRDFIRIGHPGRYVGFEPLPRCAGRVQAIIDETGVDGTVVAAALGEKAGLVRIAVPDDDFTSASMIEGLRPGRTEREFFIPALVFADAWQTLGDGEIATIKIDVEGAEHAVLAGMTSLLERQRPPVICEVLRRDADADMQQHADRTARVMQIALGAGYVVYRIVKPTGAIERLVAVSEFPADPWSKETAEDNDYLFAPSELSLEARDGFR